MIQRYRGICETCEMQFIFRAVVPLAPTDGLKFCCPRCKIELSAKLTLDPKNHRMDLSPFGFKFDDGYDQIKSPIVTVATDLPVHKIRHINALSEGGSPFIFITVKMGKSFIEWREKVEALHAMRHDHFPLLQKLAEYARSENWSMAKQCLQTRLGETPKDDLSTIHLSYRSMSTLYAPLISFDDTITLLEEYYTFLNDCFTSKNESYKNLLTQWHSMTSYQNFRTKSLNSFLRIFSHFDAFIVGLLYNEMPSDLKDNIDEYRIFRDDYSVVKSLYQDLFELSSQLQIFLGSVLNLSRRNDPWHYVTGVRSLNAFEKKPAFERFQILSELPKLGILIGGVNRLMRNSIGHFSADYEVNSGNIHYDDGTRKNYIVFLGEFFFAVKAMWFILIFIEKSDMDMKRLKIT